MKRTLQLDRKKGIQSKRHTSLAGDNYIKCNINMFCSEKHSQNTTAKESSLHRLHLPATPTSTFANQKSPCCACQSLHSHETSRQRIASEQWQFLSQAAYDIYVQFTFRYWNTFINFHIQLEKYSASVFSWTRGNTHNEVFFSYIKNCFTVTVACIPNERHVKLSMFTRPHTASNESI